MLGGGRCCPIRARGIHGADRCAGFDGRVHSVQAAARDRPRFQGGCPGSALRPRRLPAVDRHHLLLDRLHALAGRARPDPLLRMLCNRPLLHHRGSFRGQSVHALPVLRGAHPEHLPAGGPQGDAGGEGRRSQVHHLSFGRRQGLSTHRDHPDLQPHRNPRVLGRRHIS